ncbi:uncharacterized protein UV8b_04791 [Ustilaginoidea virens]|uniref:Uncharacterized protein n=1 Tax=Ustilaginoidea virens TaxID=1159556 RepID=A0A8E5HSH4_USTVR|nr:uncharacterized protein UV8b_04791 [Ustilaginoidea virens]QUC20550.1 hypothetical protein UV8b_04791 [Ustilaginoidea virens]
MERRGFSPLLSLATLPPVMGGMREERVEAVVARASLTARGFELHSCDAMRCDAVRSGTEW